LLLDLLQGFVDGEECSFRFFCGQFIKAWEGRTPYLSYDPG
jgi:hypothetical protein